MDKNKALLVSINNNNNKNNESGLSCRGNYIYTATDRHADCRPTGIDHGLPKHIYGLVSPFVRLICKSMALIYHFKSARLPLSLLFSSPLLCTRPFFLLLFLLYHAIPLSSIFYLSHHSKLCFSWL